MNFVVSGNEIEASTRGCAGVKLASTQNNWGSCTKPNLQHLSWKDEIHQINWLSQNHDLLLYIVKGESKVGLMQIHTMSYGQAWFLYDIWAWIR